MNRLIVLAIGLAFGLATSCQVAPKTQPTQTAPSPALSPTPSPELTPDPPPSLPPEQQSVYDGLKEYWAVTFSYLTDPTQTDVTPLSRVAEPDEVAEFVSILNDMVEGDWKETGEIIYRKVRIETPTPLGDTAVTKAHYCKDLRKVKFFKISTGKEIIGKESHPFIAEVATLQKRNNGTWVVTRVDNKTGNSC